MCTKYINVIGVIFLKYISNTGGAGIRKLIPLQMSTNGYAIKQLKVEAKSSTIFIIPLYSDVDQTLITIIDISTVPSSEIFSKCVTCHLEIR